jgi:hypothetical protein
MKGKKNSGVKPGNEYDREYEEKKYEVYLKERYTLIDLEREASTAFDKAIITLSSGSILFSVILVSDIFGAKYVLNLGYLILSWVAFSLSIITILVSFQTSIYSYKRQIDILENEYFGKRENLKNINRTITASLNIISISTFLIGLVLFGIFILLNI